MNKYILSLLLLLVTTQPNFAQMTEVQFPRLNYQMKMNQDLRPGATYYLQSDIIAGDKSGIVFTTAVSGTDINLQSDINSLVDLDALKFTISPSQAFSFHAFYGRYKFLGEDFVLPNGMQHNYSPNMNLYGIMPVFGSGLAITTPVEEGRYEPEIILYSSSFEGVDYLNLFFFTTFRFNFVEIQLYSGVSVPTIGSIDTSMKGSGGFAVFTAMEYINVYFAAYVSPFYGETFSFDDVYIRLSQHLLISGFEQTFSVTSLGAIEGNLNDPLIGIGGIPDLNIYVSLGGRLNAIGFGAEYGFIFGVYESCAMVNNLQYMSQRLGLYADILYLGLTYRAGVFYTLPNSGAYLKDISGSGEVGFYVSVYGRA